MFRWFCTALVAGVDNCYRDYAVTNARQLAALVAGQEAGDAPQEPLTGV